ncbi:hypothetical protein ASC55_13460 [Microbacterium sp. Root322]|uniref:hypothetical protein n=1 Tax=Microbacterium sp. Root322 TaxID=1736514 RepID=UPI0006FC92E4|nr:hypothetical protein [Microbacterium sp. Root322]KQV00198.1 hypothetical protein ASC55_13460 [Microbacterium sp. Root322]
MTEPRIALISATPLAIAPATAAITAALPAATVWNLLDDRLLADAQTEGGITAPLAARMDGLIELALAGGADGVLLTCSQFGERADRRESDAGGHTVLSADGPLFAEAVAADPERVLLVASLPSAASDSAARLAQAFVEAGSAAHVHPVVIPAAAAPLVAPELVETLAAAISDVDEPFDLVVLAQYSLAGAASALADRLGVTVLDGPAAAARRLTTVLQEERR